MVQTTSSIINRILSDCANFCIVGGPKSGKTKNLISLADAFIKQHQKPLILTARDEEIPQLQKRCDALLPARAFTLRTISSFSHAIINNWCQENNRPMPGVLTGFDQDAILQDIIASSTTLTTQTPPWFSLTSLKFRSFRNELRLLIAKALQYGWTGQNLVNISRKYLATPNGSSYLFLQLWPLCAQIIDQYFRICKYNPNSADILFWDQKAQGVFAKDINARGRGTSVAQRFYKAGQLMDINMQQILASNILRKNYAKSCTSSHAEFNPTKKQLILVDSAQNLSPLAQQFLQSLALRAQIVIFLDPDSAINTHQGADTKLIDFPNSKVISLDQYKFPNPHIQNVVNRVSSSIGVNKYFEHRVPQIKISDTNTPATPAYAKVYSDRQEQYREIGKLILFLNRFKAVSFNKIALVLRSRENFEMIEDALNDLEIPTVRDKVMAAKDPLIIEICAMAEAAAKDLPKNLNSSNYKTYDFLLTLWKGSCEIPADELIKEERAKLMQGKSAERFGFSYLVHLMRRFDNLDAFFNFAEKFTHTHSQQDIDLFLQIWNAQKHESFPSKGERGMGVVLTTPSGIADRQFDAVILPDINEHIWPNLKIRDRLLGAGFLDVASSTEPITTYAEFIKRSKGTLRNHELQMLLASVAASRKFLFATAVENDRDSASCFLNYFTQIDIPITEHLSPSFVNQQILPARSFKDHLLTQLMQEENLPKQASSILNGSSPDKNTQTVDALFALSYMNKGKGLPRKIPLMRAPTSKNCLIDLSSLQFRSSPKLSLSPSSLSSFLICPVCWFFSQYACAGVSNAQKFGITLHLLAQNVEYHTSLNDFFKYAKEIVSNIKLPKWEKEIFEKRIAFAAENLWSFFNKRSIMTIGSEIPFSFTFNVDSARFAPFLQTERRKRIQITIKGRLDKLCMDEGALYVLDIKSGEKGSRVYKFKDRDLSSPQLVSYAMAIKFAKNKEMREVLQAVERQSAMQEQPKSAFLFPESKQRNIVKINEERIDLEEFKQILAEIAILQSGNITSFAKMHTGFLIYPHQHAHFATTPPCSILLRKEITDL